MKRNQFRLLVVAAASRRSHNCDINEAIANARHLIAPHAATEESVEDSVWLTLAWQGHTKHAVEKSVADVRISDKTEIIATTNVSRWRSYGSCCWNYIERNTKTGKEYMEEIDRHEYVIFFFEIIQ